MPPHRRSYRSSAHFSRRFNASGPLERVLILIVIAAVIGITVGLLLPRVNPDAAKLTGGYTATGSAADTLNKLTVDDNQSAHGYDRDSFAFRSVDTDGNGCDARDDVLARDLTNVKYKYAGSCVVVSGTLDDPYTGQTINFVRGRTTSAKVQIDHLVALLVQYVWFPCGVGLLRGIPACIIEIDERARCASEARAQGGGKFTVRLFHATAERFERVGVRIVFAALLVAVQRPHA